MHTWASSSHRATYQISLLGQSLFRQAHPTPILFYFSVRRKWSHNQNKRALTPFAPCLLPPCSLSSPPTATPPQLGCSVTSLPAWGREHEQSPHLQARDAQKPQASVSTRSARDPSQSNGIVTGRICSLPWPQDPAQGPRSPVRHLLWR